MSGENNDSSSLNKSVSFTKLTAADYELYYKYFNRYPNYISDLCFNSRIAWNLGFNYHKAIIADALVIVAQRDVLTELHFSAPIGINSDEALQTIVDTLWYPYAEMSAVLRNDHVDNRPYLRFLFVDETLLPYFKSLSGYEIDISFNEDYSDYFYDAEKMRSLAGKALHKKRNHLNNFKEKHPEIQYSSLKTEDLPEALELAQNWSVNRGFDFEDIRTNDFVAIRNLFANYSALSIRGGALREQGKLVAFSIYTETADCVFCHFEKAAVGYEDAYVAINNLTLCNEFPEIKWVNREEDMGIEALRKAKHSYKPLKMINKFEVKIWKK